MQFLKIKFDRAWIPVTCHYCGKEISTGGYLVVWYKIINKKLRWGTNKYFHVDCFKEFGTYWVDFNPQPQRTGRPKLKLSEEERKKRRREQKRKSYQLTKSKKCGIIETNRE